MPKPPQLLQMPARAADLAVAQLLGSLGELSSCLCMRLAPGLWGAVQKEMQWSQGLWHAQRQYDGPTCWKGILAGGQARGCSCKGLGSGFRVSQHKGSWAQSHGSLFVKCQAAL